jgi:hypothetical protein
MEKEFAHYVVTAHQPGGVLVTAKCNFIACDSMVRERVFLMILHILRTAQTHHDCDTFYHSRCIGRSRGQVASSGSSSAAPAGSSRLAPHCYCCYLESISNRRPSSNQWPYNLLASLADSVHGNFVRIHGDGSTSICRHLLRSFQPKQQQ